MQNQLSKAIKLAKKTGDKLIVFEDIKSDSPYVIMSLDEYEKMIIKNSQVKGLTEQELIDKINRDIAIWKSEQKYEGEIPVYKDHMAPIAPNFIKHYDQNEHSDQTDYITQELENRKKAKIQWQIPTDRKRNAEEIVENKPEYDEDEDRHYLEQITF